eukprot:scpid86593/ scgid17307/ Glutaredoxin-like protein C5orf63 homolog
MASGLKLYSICSSSLRRASALGLGPQRALRPCSSKTSSGLETPVLTLFTKAGCTLCVTALDDIEDAIDDGAYTLRTVDITAAGNEVWMGRYQYDIPVFHLNGHFLMKHRADCALLAAELAKLKP